VRSFAYSCLFVDGGFKTVHKNADVGWSTLILI
jgi:hypothetical protein